MKPARPLMPKVGPVGRFFAALVVRSLSALSRPALGRLASFVGGLAWTLGIRRKLTLENLRLAMPELDEAERRRIAKGAYRNMALAALESLVSESVSNEEMSKLVGMQNWEVMEKARAEGKGVLLVTMHFGSWEVLGDALCRRGLPLHAVVRPLDGAINARIVQSRLSAGMKLIAPRGAVNASVKALGEGGVVAMLVDQVIAAKHGVFVPFFGRLASTNPAVALVARRSGAPVVVGVSVRDGVGLQIHFEGPFPVPDTGDPAEDLRLHTEQLTGVLEKWIRRYPDQWLWLHRRWKVQPPAELSAGKERAA